VSYRIILLVGFAVLAGACKEPIADSCDGSVDTGDASQTADDAGETEECDLAQALREVMGARRSADYFAPFGTDPLTLEDVMAICWAAQGITLPDAPTGWPDVLGLRTAPSAGATYPIEVYVVAENVTGLAQGAYRYDPFDDTLVSTGATGPLTEAVAQIRIDENPSSDPKVLSDAAALFILAGVHQRTSDKYGTWAELYVALEAGHVAQNVLLMATAKGLANRPWGALSEDGRQQVADLLLFSEDEPLATATNPSCFQPVTSRAQHWPLYFLGVGQKP
jgi:SagB-type dehydrogenase family enzyme